MKYRLDECSINAACENANSFLEKRRSNPKDLILAKLSMEEVLLTYLQAFGSDVEFSVDYGGSLTKSWIRLTVPGPSLDPFASTEAASDDEFFLSNALTRMDRRPKWQYARSANTILYTLEKKSLPDWKKLLIAIISAIALGMAARMLPANTATALQREVVSPLLQTFLGFLNAVAGPMIFLSVVWGIYSIGDASTFSGVGSRLCVRFLLFQCLTTALIVLVSLPFVNHRLGSTQDGSHYAELYRMILNIVPDNLFTPFSRGNTLQILFIADIVGIAMLLIGKNTQTVANLVEQLGYVVDGIMRFISRIVPVFVFGSIFSITVSSDLSSLAAGGKFFVGVVAGSILLMVFQTAVTCVKLRMSPFDLWKRTFSTFLIAITTASSTAAFSDNKKVCTEKLGVSQRLANFGVPFGQILYKPGVSILFWFAAVTVAESSGTVISPMWYITAVVICIIFSIASPPVPGGMMASFAVLFAQLGLPDSNFAVILSLTPILDFILTAADVQGGQCILAMSARSIDNADERK